MEDWLIWILLSIGLVVAEMTLTSGFWLACLAAGAAVAGVLALIPGVGVALQGVAFAATSLLSMAGVRPALVRAFQLGPGTGVRTGVEALLGKAGVVTERIGRHAIGRVKVEGEDWRGATLEDVTLEPGTRITVVQVDGTTLVVEKEP